MYYYLANFLLFCIVGSIFEETIKLLWIPHLQSGILNGPFVYGFGIVIILFIGKWVEKKIKGSKIKRYLVIFLIVTFLLTGLEWLGGMLIECIFHKVMWSYQDVPLHIGHYIAVPISIGWGIGSCIFLLWIKPWTDKLIKKIPRIWVYLVFFLFLFDVFNTFILKGFIYENLIDFFYFF